MFFEKAYSIEIERQNRNIKKEMGIKDTIVKTRFFSMFCLLLFITGNNIPVMEN